MLGRLRVEGAFGAYTCCLAPDSGWHITTVCFSVWHFLHVFWGCSLCVARCAVVFGPKMEFSLEDFVADPTLEKLDCCNKNKMISIAARFEIPVVKQDKKKIIKGQIHSALAEKDILPPVVKVSTEYHGVHESVSSMKWQ